ncbi:MAG: sulfatase [Thermoprotei archaeon]|nr:MAG: sulfatase [Thermofilum sp. ex4484_79]RLF08707.1 MAG: sulfatase [Thermoprotei archaeon]
MNIIFIAIDTLRADHLSCYGYSRPTSPFLDSLASKGVLFERCYASDIPTQPAYTTIYTSHYGVEHSIVSHGSEIEVLSPKFRLLTEYLRDAGYTTVAVDNLVEMKPWFRKGYEYYTLPYGHIQLITANKITNYAIKWLKYLKEDNKPFFMFLHYWDPHAPYTPPEEYRHRFYKGDPFDKRKSSLMEAFKKYPFHILSRNWIRDLLGDVQDIEYICSLYDAEILYTNDQLRVLFNFLEENEMLEDILVIITADHGESLTEHGIFFDHHGVYETNIHVPLIMFSPGRLPQGLRVKTLIEHVDLAPTILEITGIEMPEDMRGRSLIRLINGEVEEKEFVVSGECTYQAFRAIVTSDGWKLIKKIGGDFYGRPKLQLYNLKEDPEEKVDLHDDYPDILKELELKLNHWVEDNLGEKADPIRVQLEHGLPGHEWLRRALERQGISWEEWLKRQRYF